MVIATHESYDSVLIWTGKQKGLESLSERRRRDVKRQVVPDGGTRNRKRLSADCRDTNGETNGCEHSVSGSTHSYPSYIRCNNVYGLTLREVNTPFYQFVHKAWLSCRFFLSFYQSINQYFSVRLKVDPRAGQLSLPHVRNQLNHKEIELKHNKNDEQINPGNGLHTAMRSVRQRETGIYALK